MKAHRLYTAITATLLFVIIVAMLAFNTRVAIAESTSVSSIFNPSSYPITLEVNGDKLLLGPGSQVSIYNESIVCISGEEQYIYASDRTRFKFSGWLVDDLVINDSCVRIGVEPPRIVKPYFVEEVLLVVVSKPEGIYSYSEWAAKGTLVPLSAPQVVDDDRTRYVFRMWSTGIDRYSPEMLVPAVKPVVLTAVYDVYYLVDFQGMSGSVYVKEGDKLVLIPEEFKVVGESKLLYPKGFLVNGEFYEVKGESVSITVSEPIVVEPVYKVMYKVRIVGPDKIEESWIAEGDTFKLDAGSVIQVSEDRRLILDKVIVNGLVYNLPKIEVIVKEPLNIELIYKEQVRVLVNSVLGREVRWVDKGSPFSLVYPTRLGGVLVSSVLDSYVVNGEPVRHVGGTLIVDSVMEPLTINVVYKRQIEYKTLIGVSLVLSLTIYYIISRFI
ncbi:MAG: hypothetical protein F7C81_05825 [Desulfurococcales archaeon]|nr:hypothetical protein [Desulfurococcales archaeon]